MRRIISLLCASAVLATGATACGGSDDANSTSSTTAATATAADNAAVDRYCELVNTALAASKAGDAATVKATVSKLQAAYAPALAAIK
ncbi:MAG: hypothetical protein ACKOYM_09475, partial [Actinomycetes bacterium]